MDEDLFSDGKCTAEFSRVFTLTKEYRVLEQIYFDLDDDWVKGNNKLIKMEKTKRKSPKKIKDQKNSLQEIEKKIDDINEDMNKKQAEMVEAIRKSGLCTEAAEKERGRTKE